ncbi:hypothetical protein BYT27DRAFT_6948895 [Phlegmacium glaucopus]|nr:hypothetical protein BYT27DRAFT_6948895 [Phlegmacium glaucopus]
MFSNLKNTLVTGGTFNAAQGDIHHHNYLGGRKGIDLLYSSIAPGAFHNSAERYDPPKCHPATRVAVLEYIMKWINDLNRLCLFLWLYGPAGAGKSAIAQTIAEKCHELKILAASFFFSRTAVGRNDESRLIPTIVYQLCQSIPAIRKYVEDTLEQDPLILSRSLEAQFHGLVVGPLNHAFPSKGDGRKSPQPGPTLIIIDGLDECGNGKAQRYILTVLAGAVKQLPFPILFLVASRPEQDIRDIFNSTLLAPTTARLALDDSYLPDNDIEVFLKSRFDDIKKDHELGELLPSSWPSASQIQRLVQKSSGQFIYASTVMKYVNSPRHRPTQRLDVIFGITNPGNDTPFAELDALYLHIFSSVREIDKVLEVLWVLLLLTIHPTTGMTPYFVEDLLFPQRGDLYMTLSDVHSIIDIPLINLAKKQPVRILHASLGDFLLDKSRSQTLHIDAEHAHATLTRYLLKRISYEPSTYEPSIQDSHRVAFYSALIPQCTLAYPTEELLEDLRKFDILKFIRSGTISSFWIIAHLPPLFMWMEKQ